MGLRGSRWSALLILVPVAIGLWFYAGDRVVDVRSRFATRGVAASETTGPGTTGVGEDGGPETSISPVAHPVDADAKSDVVGVGTLSAVFSERRFSLESHAVLHLSLELLDAAQMEFFGLDPNPAPPTSGEIPETSQTTAEEGSGSVPSTSPPPTLPGAGRVSWYLVEGHVSYDISAFVCRPAEGWESCEVERITDGDLRGFARRRGNQFILRLEWVPLGRSGEPSAPALVARVVDEKGFPFEVPVGDLAQGLESSDLMGNGMPVTINAETVIEGRGDVPLVGSMVLSRP